jgi:hypothetical protein
VRTKGLQVDASRPGRSEVFSTTASS